ncbi:MAG: MnhB domain-containing protein [Acidilobaceae archaeon]
MRLDEIIMLYFLMVCPIVTLFTVIEKDVMKAIIKSSLQSLSLLMILVTLQAPELVLVYLSIGVGAYSILFISALMVMRRHESNERRAKTFELSTGVVLALLTFLLISAIFVYNVTGGSPSDELKDLGSTYLRIAYNSTAKEWWSKEQRVVVSILWDYRGVDTLFELVVLSTAIVASVASFKLLWSRADKIYRAELSPIPKIGLKIVAALVVVMSSALLLSKFLPGGGFQSGIALAVAPAMLMAAFSGVYERLGFTEWRLTTALVLCVTILAIVALIPIALGGAALQNQAKPWLDFKGFELSWGPLHLTASIKVFDILEAVIVASGFSLTFLFLLAPPEVTVALKEKLRWK